MKVIASTGTAYDPAWLVELDCREIELLADINRSSVRIGTTIDVRAIYATVSKVMSGQTELDNLARLLRENANALEGASKALATAIKAP